VPSLISGRKWAAPLRELVDLLTRRGTEPASAEERRALKQSAAKVLRAVPSLFSPRAAQALEEMGLAERIAPADRGVRLGGVGRARAAKAPSVPDRAKVLVVGGSIGGYSAALAAIEAGVPPREIVVAEQRSTDEQTRRQGIGFDAATLNFWRK